jgi:hypothetical protein
MSDVAAVVLRQIEAVDRMPPNLRQCAHEYGYAIVEACMQAGVRDPRKIRNLVREIWAGARQPKQKTSGNRNATMDHLDWVLIQAGAEISAARLVRFLHDFNWAIVPLFPNRAMLSASMAEVSGFDERMTKTEKHTRRLTAALRAGSMSLWPHLYTNEQLKGTS